MGACGQETAERLVAEMLARQTSRLPPDIAIYARAIVRILAAQPRERAEAAVALARQLGGLPSRAEILALCASPSERG